MRRILIDGIALAAVLLAACGGGGGYDPETGTEPTYAYDPSVGAQDITFGISLGAQPALAQGSQRQASAAIVDIDDVDTPDEREPFTAAVAMRSVSPMPPGVDVEFAPSNLRVGDAGAVVVRATSDAQAGRHQLLIGGTIAGGSGTRYGPHEAVVTASCAPGTPALRHVFPSTMDRTVGIGGEGEVFVWGHNAPGHSSELPPDSALPVTIDFYTAQRIDDMPAAVWAASTRGASLVVLADGGLRLLGRHYRSPIGAPQGRAGWQIVQVPDASGFTQVVADDSRFHALRNDGTVWRIEFTVGLDGSLRAVAPTPEAGFSDIQQLAAGDLHLLALRRDGTVLAMGANVHGQLGTGDTSPSSAPVPVPGLTEVVRIAAGAEHSIAVRANTVVAAWGRNDNGQVGNGRQDGVLRPTEVLSAAGNVFNAVIDAAAGDAHTVLLRTDGSVWTFGRGASGELGTGTAASPRLSPSQVGTVLASEIRAARRNTLLRVFAWTGVQGWGDNHGGALGDGTADLHDRPVDALGIGAGSDRPCRSTSTPGGG
jgi:alpha-tubulin suppressor-like RCC1 family protein